MKTKYLIAYKLPFETDFRPFIRNADQSGPYGWLDEAVVHLDKPKVVMPDYDKVVTYEEALEIEREWRQMALLDEL